MQLNYQGNHKVPSKQNIYIKYSSILIDDTCNPKSLQTKQFFCYLPYIR